MQRDHSQEATEEGRRGQDLPWVAAQRLQQGVQVFGVLVGCCLYAEEGSADPP